MLENFLLAVLPMCWKGKWLTVDEMATLTSLDCSTVRWCLRKLKTGEEGDFIIRRRKRQPAAIGKTEIYIKRKPAQMRLDFSA